MATKKLVKNSMICAAAVVCSLLAAAFFGGPVRAAEGGGGVYGGIDVQPLSIADCARCHFSHYSRIKDQGARHTQVRCTDCHQVFHAYNPLRNNYAELMPDCSMCHDAPHGPAEPLQECLACHRDPHQPLATIPAPADIEDRCRGCHGDIAQLLKDDPSMHTDQECSSCHSEVHGRIPQCAECHDSHSPMAGLDTPDCLACHPVHTPLRISYPVTQSKEVCAGCHDTAYALLEARITRHSELTCAECHPGHGEIPACQRCHGEPHNPSIHEKYSECGSCHGIAHDVQR